MFLALPLAVWIGLFLVIQANGHTWRSSILVASIFWGVILVLFTELLSPLGLITFPWLLAAWGMAAFTVAANYGRIRRTSRSVHIPSFNNLELSSLFFLWAVMLTLGTIG